jgi:hypothetical protein
LYVMYYGTGMYAKLQDTPRVEKIESAIAFEELNSVGHSKRLEVDQTEPTATSLLEEVDIGLPCPTPEPFICQQKI